MMGQYRNIVLVDDEKEVILIAGKEGRKAVNDGMLGKLPVNLVIQKDRSLFKALKRSWEYSKMGIFNCVVRVT